MPSQVFLSIDIEADGPIPGRNSMLSFGVAAFEVSDAPNSREPIATFEATIVPLEEATPSPETMAWWAEHPEAYEVATRDARPATTVMPEFLTWIEGLPKKPVVIGYPVTYDFMFLYWYTMAFGGLEDGVRCPFGFQGLDIKTMAWMKMGDGYKRATKRNMPSKWFRGSPKHNHEALTDAIGQGILFLNMLEDTEGGSFW